MLTVELAPVETIKVSACNYQTVMEIQVNVGSKEGVEIVSRSTDKLSTTMRLEPLICLRISKSRLLSFTTKHYRNFSSTWIQTQTLNTHCFAQHFPPNNKNFQQSKTSTTHSSCSFGPEQGV